LTVNSFEANKYVASLKGLKVYCVVGIFLSVGIVLGILKFTTLTHSVHQPLVLDFGSDLRH